MDFDCNLTHMRFRPSDQLLYLFLRLAKRLDRRQTDIRHLKPEEIKTILVVSSTAIGDTLLSTPAIRAVRERYPSATIIAHFNKQNMALFQNNPDIDGIVPYHGGYRRFVATIRDLRRHRFDLALIFHGNEPQASPMAYLSCARFIIKLPSTSEYRFLLSNREPVLTWNDFRHGIDQRLKVAELAGAPAASPRMVLPLTPEGERATDGFLAENGIAADAALVGFQVGASTVSRMWLADRFVELGKRLLATFPGIRIILTGSPQEQKYCQAIAARIGPDAVVSAGQIALEYLPSLVARFKTLVTGDTGIMHLAVAVGTPVVALFAASDARRSGPSQDPEKHTVIQKWRTCEPCLSKKCGYAKCMENIAVDEVHCAVIPQLKPRLHLTAEG